MRASFRPATTADEPTLLELMREFYRHEGMAWDERAARAALHGVRALHLEVERRNTRAQEIYRKAGFVDREHYLMTRRLAPGGGSGGDSEP